MKVKADQYRVRPGKQVKLAKWATRIEPLCESKEEYARARAEYLAELQELQNLLYAHDCYSLLLIFQAMDAAGKDGAIKHVMSGVNPQGCQVFAFKPPSEQELDHDFLWRAALSLPERGRIGIFNRSYYEEVLIVRVHPERLEEQKLPADRMGKNIWKERFESIRSFEEHLHRNGTIILKFFLHLSRDEQKKRLLKRLDHPESNWKFSMSDVEERKFWPEYMKAYEDVLSATSTEDAPWHIVPADHKPDTRLIISQLLIDTLRKLKMEYPKLNAEQRAELKNIRRALEKDQS